MVPLAVFGIVSSGLAGPKKQFAQAGPQGQDRFFEASSRKFQAARRRDPIRYLFARDRIA
jgi:hypothetical protein